MMQKYVPVCARKDGMDEKLKCLIDRGQLEVFDISADFDDSHKTGKHQVYHAMIVVGDDVFEMNAQALAPNGLNIWSGEVWQWDDFRDRKKDVGVTDVDLLPPQMKTAIWDRFAEIMEI